MVLLHGSWPCKVFPPQCSVSIKCNKINVVFFFLTHKLVLPYSSRCGKSNSMYPAAQGKSLIGPHSAFLSFQSACDIQLMVQHGTHPNQNSQSEPSGRLCHTRHCCLNTQYKVNEMLNCCYTELFREQWYGKSLYMYMLIIGIITFSVFAQRLVESAGAEFMEMGGLLFRFFF